MAKPKPKGWNAMSKTKQEAWKKANFDTSTKVTEAQLTKLRQAGTPTAAITKYASDPSMREALNRFYGKDRVNAVKQNPAVTGSTTVRGGPGAKMPKPPRGGPGSKTGRDGRELASKKTVTMGSRTGGPITVNKAANDKRKAEFQKRTDNAITAVSLVPAVGLAGASLKTLKAAGTVRKAITSGPKAITSGPKKPLAIGPGPKASPKKSTPKKGTGMKSKSGASKSPKKPSMPVKGNKANKGWK